jgi:peptidoglycan/xylan/chitin deacetylase (PgdA/CDA1 family)
VIKSIARQVFHASGGLGAARWLNRRRLRILMYHRFGDREATARQCAHIRAHYTPVSLTQAAGWLADGGWPDNALVVTVDDGYRDFYQVAFPVFREYGIPATVYLVSEFIDGRQWLWVDRVRWSYLNSASPLGSREERLAAARKAIEAAKLMPNHERLAWLDCVPTELGVRPPEQAPPEFEAMRWDEVREAARNGMEFGAHTVTHPILSRVSGSAEMRGEIEGSKRRIEEELGGGVEHFCYPNGSERDFTGEAVEVVRAAGFRTATTTTLGIVSPGDDALRLRRIGVEPGYEERYFAECAAALRA